MDIFIVLSYCIIIIYSLILLYILFYNLIQFQLWFNYRTKENCVPEMSESDWSTDWPKVTVQLPTYNEKFVIGRLIDNICALDYPKDRLEIQVLDDSTDDTLTISQAKVAQYRNAGFDIQLIHRKDRTGYKAGALQNGLKLAQGEFIAIFDADFLPKSDFLQKTVPYFQQSNVGVVQARWEHLNQDHSIITEVQAFQLNVHFTVEQSARCHSEYLLQFNGTAGVWRKTAIEEAGGWHADTLTEDLDLSYRAQLKGWKILYQEAVGAPAELPNHIFSYKSQQYRWMKGGAETAKKLIGPILKSDISFGKKIHALAHLTGSAIFLLVFTMAILSVPMLWAISKLHLNMGYFMVFVLGILGLACTFYQANVLNPYNYAGLSKYRKVLKFIFLFPIFMSLSMGLSLHNSMAVIQGWRGKRTPFIRTPKTNLDHHKNQREENKKAGIYVATLAKLNKATLLEGLMCLYFIFGIIAGILMQNYSMIILHILLVFGFGSIFFFSIKELRIR